MQLKTTDLVWFAKYIRNVPSVFNYFCELFILTFVLGPVQMGGPHEGPFFALLYKKAVIIFCNFSLDGEREKKIIPYILSHF